MNWLTGIPLIGDVIKTVFGSKQERDLQDSNYKSSTSSQFAQEFGHGRNWFDSLIDGLNRLPRPVFAFGTIYLFAFCWIDPEGFVAGAKNLELMPSEMWIILGTIITFFFGGRLSKEFGNYKIKQQVLNKYQTQKNTPEKQEEEPSEDITWNKRVKERYDFDGLNN